MIGTLPQPEQIQYELILEENPKWNLLRETLEEIEKENQPDSQSAYALLFSIFFFKKYYLRE